MADNSNNSVSSVDGTEKDNVSTVKVAEMDSSISAELNTDEKTINDSTSPEANPTTITEGDSAKENVPNKCDENVECSDEQENNPPETEEVEQCDETNGEADLISDKLGNEQSDPPAIEDNIIQEAEQNVNLEVTHNMAENEIKDVSDDENKDNNCEDDLPPDHRSESVELDENPKEPEAKQMEDDVVNPSGNINTDATTEQDENDKDTSESLPEVSAAEEEKNEDAIADESLPQDLNVTEKDNCQIVDAVICDEVNAVERDNEISNESLPSNEITTSEEQNTEVPVNFESTAVSDELGNEGSTGECNEPSIEASFGEISEENMDSETMESVQPEETEKENLPEEIPQCDIDHNEVTESDATDNQVTEQVAEDVAGGVEVNVSATDGVTENQRDPEVKDSSAEEPMDHSESTGTDSTPADPETNTNEEHSEQVNENNAALDQSDKDTVHVDENNKEKDTAEDAAASSEEKSDEPMPVVEDDQIEKDTAEDAAVSSEDKSVEPTSVVEDDQTEANKMESDQDGEKVDKMESDQDGEKVDKMESDQDGEKVDTNSLEDTDPVKPKESETGEKIPTVVDLEDKNDDVAIVGEEKPVDSKKKTDEEDKKERTSKPSQSSKESTKESKSKSPQKCIVCEKVGKCKYNIVRNGDIKHLCDDKCFKIFRANPTSYLKGKNDAATTNGTPSKNSITSHSKYEKNPPKEIVVEDDVEILGTSKTVKSPTPGITTRGASTISKCSVCGKNSSIKHEVTFNNVHNKLCSDPCFAAFRYANKLAMTSCDNCKKICQGENNANTLQFIGAQKRFCTPVCMNTFKTKNQKVVACTWCQAKKSNFDMVERIDTSNKTQLFCSLNCLSLYRVNLQATSNQSVTCDQCKKFAPAQYHLTMSDASVRNFCSYNCVMAFQGQFQSPQTGAGRGQAGKTSGSAANSSKSRTRGGSRSSSRVANKAATTNTIAAPGRNQPVQNQNMPLISQVVSLAPDQVIPTSGTTENQALRGRPTVIAPGGQATKTVTKTVKEITTQTKVLVQPPQAKTTKNKSMLCKPFTQTKATSCRPHAQSKEVQTGEDLITKPALVPIPIPIYVPAPMAMYSIPVPYPVPIPIPIPVPCFIPTTKKSAAGILKQINKIQSSMPADPFEAELLGMAAALAGDDGDSSSSSDEDNEDYSQAPAPIAPVAQQQQPAPQPAVDDMLQMAMRMTMPQNVMDLENSVAPTPVNPENASMPTYPSQMDTLHEMVSPDVQRGRGRGKRRGSSRGRSNQSKKMKIEEQEPTPEPIQVVPQQPPPDEHMVLKFTYGVNAWKHWVMQKNEQLQKASTRSRGRLKLYKPDILACTPDELNFSLCQFVNEVRKPNGEEYAPDSIYYLCLGIQEYLYENGRVDNIFTDLYYDRFTECLDDVIKRYEVRLNAQGLIVCRIEEEHLWESKQLGAHSPFVLLNTLIYFNARYFMLRTPEEHLRLSFSHIMKHWKKTNMPGSRQPGRSVYLRYYAPVHQSEVGNKRRREELPVFEQGENIENPLRCPVKLYEFYLSKCPESIKNRNDVFYLMPERSCVPDSPVWYSTGSLPIEIMTRMLNRIRVIKEIQEAHLAYQPVGLV